MQVRRQDKRDIEFAFIFTAAAGTVPCMGHGLERGALKR